jgi:uncharacterized protein (DUF1697 family)
MSRFVAFLRGINVGGHTATKQQLQEAFSSVGLKNIYTVKQTGNVIFESDGENADGLEKHIENRLLEILGYEVVVFLRTHADLQNMIDMEPFHGQQSEGTSFLVTFLKKSSGELPWKLPHIIPKSTALIISASGHEVFSVTHGGGEGGLPNPYLEHELKIKATTRNMNTINEILLK